MVLKSRKMGGYDVVQQHCKYVINFTFEVLHFSTINKCFLFNLIKITRLFYIKKIFHRTYFSPVEPSDLLSILSSVSF